MVFSKSVRWSSRDSLQGLGLPGRVLADDDNFGGRREGEKWTVLRCKQSREKGRGNSDSNSERIGVYQK